MFLLRDHWRYDFFETDDGVWIVEKGQMGIDNGVIVLDDIEFEEEAPRKPWCFMLDGQEHLYR